MQWKQTKSNFLNLNIYNKILCELRIGIKIAWKNNHEFLGGWSIQTTSYRRHEVSLNWIALTLIVFGGGGTDDVTFSEKCPCSYNYTTALIKQLSLFDAILVITNS